MSGATPDELRAAGRLEAATAYPGTIRSVYPFWDVQYRPFLLMAVDALPRDGFDFKPRPEMLTAREIVLHVAEAERWWVHHIVDGGAYEDWIVEAEDPSQGFRVTGEAPDHATMLAELERWHRPTQAWFAKPLDELGRVIAHQRPEGPERRFTLHWILDHLQEHEIHHRAQLNLYLRLMGVTPPSI